MKSKMSTKKKLKKGKELMRSTNDRKKLIYGTVNLILYKGIRIDYCVSYM